MKSNSWKYFFIIFILLIFIAIPLIPGNTQELSYNVHGKLYVSNGTPSIRMWVIGTKRILGIHGGDTEPAEMPQELEKLLIGENPFETEIFGDFVVSPFTRQKLGEMQIAGSSRHKI